MTRRKTRRAWGSVTEIQHGKKYVLRWMENTPEGRKRKTRTVRGTYREACMELDRIHVERADDKPVPTIAKAYATWLLPSMAAQVEAGELSQSSLGQYTRSWTNYIEPRWGATPVDQLRAVELQEWLLTLSERTAKTAMASCSTATARAPRRGAPRYSRPRATGPSCPKRRLHQLRERGWTVPG